MAGIHLTSPSPQTALSQFLPRSLALILAGSALLLAYRAGRAGLRLIWDRARPHLLWLLICLAGWIMSRLVYLWGEHSMAAYAPFRIWPSLGLNNWSDIAERWLWLGRYFVPQAFELGVPFLRGWAVWALFAPVPLAILWIGGEALLALFRSGWGRWLDQNRLDLAYALSAAGLLGAVLFTQAAINQVGYRYLLLLIAWWPFLLIRLGVRLGRISKPAGVVFLALPLVLLTLSQGANLSRPEVWTHVPDRARYASLEKLMNEAGLRSGLADYWVAYNASNLTHERLIVTPGPEFETHLIRYLPYARAVAQAERKAYIFRRAYDWRLVEKLRARFTAQRRYFTWLENEDWILLKVEGEAKPKS